MGRDIVLAVLLAVPVVISVLVVQALRWAFPTRAERQAAEVLALRARTAAWRAELAWPRDRPFNPGCPGRPVPVAEPEWDGAGSDPTEAMLLNLVWS